MATTTSGTDSKTAVSTTPQTTTTVTGVQRSTAGTTLANQQATVLQQFINATLQASVPTIAASINRSVQEQLQQAEARQCQQIQQLQAIVQGTRMAAPISAGRVNTSGQSISTNNTVSGIATLLSAPQRMSAAPTSFVQTGANIMAQLPLISSSITNPVFSIPNMANPLSNTGTTNTSSGSITLLPSTQLASLVPDTVREKSKSKRAIIVSPSSPPVPIKLAESIWLDEYIDLSELYQPS